MFFRPVATGFSNGFQPAGATILACIALIAIYNWLLPNISNAEAKHVVWLESMALWAFGWTWFVKGEGLQPSNDVE